MKPRKIDKFTPAPPGMKKVHSEYYMAYPRAFPKKKAPSAPARKKAPSAPARNVTVRKRKKPTPFNIDAGKKKVF